jgi:hypothetical protein
VGQCNDLENIVRGLLGQFPKNRGGVKLPTGFIPGKTDIVNHRFGAAGQAEDLRNYFFDGRQDIGIERTDGSNLDGRFGGRGQDGL